MIVKHGLKQLTTLKWIHYCEKYETLQTKFNCSNHLVFKVLLNIYFVMFIIYKIALQLGYVQIILFEILISDFTFVE